MKSKPAYVHLGDGGNRRQRRATLRAGAKGRGALLLEVTYWPWSAASVEGMWTAFKEFAERNEYTIVGSSRDKYE